MPESFSVLINELRGLCLNVQMRGGKPAPATRL
jgi:DNA-directed RNA polymerase beta subunit